MYSYEVRAYYRDEQGNRRWYYDDVLDAPSALEAEKRVEEMLDERLRAAGNSFAGVTTEPNISEWEADFETIIHQLMVVDGMDEIDAALALCAVYDEADVVRDLLALIKNGSVWSNEEKVTPHLKHVGQLEVAWYGPEDDPDSVTVECTKCGEVISNLWERE